jgi:hypothetical protein
MRLKNSVVSLGCKNRAKPATVARGILAAAAAKLFF